MRVELDAALEPLVAAAVRGEEVELTRGGRVVAAVVRRTPFAGLAGRQVTEDSRAAWLERLRAFHAT